MSKPNPYMTSIIKIFTVLLFAGIIHGCSPDNGFRIEGKWQSLNNKTSVVEFLPNNIVDLYRNGEPVWSRASTNGHLKYTIKEIDKTWYYLQVLDQDEIFLNTKLEIVNENRIRLHFYKHHNILDLADEYQRTDDFNSFSEIMSEIMEEPDTGKFIQ